MFNLSKQECWRCTCVRVGNSCFNVRYHVSLSPTTAPQLPRCSYLTGSLHIFLSLYQTLTPLLFKGERDPQKLKKTVNIYNKYMNLHSLPTSKVMADFFLSMSDVIISWDETHDLPSTPCYWAMVYLSGTLCNGALNTVNFYLGDHRMEVIEGKSKECLKVMKRVSKFMDLAISSPQLRNEHPDWVTVFHAADHLLSSMLSSLRSDGPLLLSVLREETICRSLISLWMLCPDMNWVTLAFPSLVCKTHRGTEEQQVLMQKLSRFSPGETAQMCINQIGVLARSARTGKSEDLAILPLDPLLKMVNVLMEDDTSLALLFSWEISSRGLISLLVPFLFVLSAQNPNSRHYIPFPPSSLSVLANVMALHPKLVSSAIDLHILDFLFKRYNTHTPPKDSTREEIQGAGRIINIIALYTYDYKSLRLIYKAIKTANGYESLLPTSVLYRIWGIFSATYLSCRIMLETFRYETPGRRSCDNEKVPHTRSLSLSIFTEPITVLLKAWKEEREIVQPL